MAISDKFWNRLLVDTVAERNPYLVCCIIVLGAFGFFRFLSVRIKGGISIGLSSVFTVMSGETGDSTLSDWPATVTRDDACSSFLSFPIIRSTDILPSYLTFSIFIS